LYTQETVRDPSEMEGFFIARFMRIDKCLFSIIFYDD
jgi:hypothetical protein